MKYTLYHFPLACGRITMSALEEAGVDYDLQLVNLLGGEQRSPAYLAVNPHGKIPALLVDDQLLTENVALILYLEAMFPQAGLLPNSANAIARAAALSDLVWCSATLHPTVRMLRAPMAYTVGDVGPVQEKGRALAPAMLAEFEARLTADTWWFGADWSIVDVYVWWLGDICARTDFDLSPYPAVIAHGERVRARPSFARVVARERAAIEAGGTSLPPGMSL